MNRLGRTMVSTAAVAAACALAHAGDPAASKNPYVTITARNVFGLQPLEPIAAPPLPAEPLPKIVLNGFMTIFGHEQVLFKVVALKNAPDDRNNGSYCVLSEGEQRDDISVVRINFAAGTVTFDNHGARQEISLFDKAK
jgi:hypothetical protein